jgi:hypothetical protein
LVAELHRVLNAMETQGKSATMATSSTHVHEPPTKPTLLADQPLPHIFKNLLNLRDDVTHLIQITIEQGSKIQEQEAQIKELGATVACKIIVTCDDFDFKPPQLAECWEFRFGVLIKYMRKGPFHIGAKFEGPRVTWE